jgi:undecaprenyl-diphosphatase
LTDHALRITSLSLYCAAVALSFWGVFQVDVPFAKWIQGINDPWFERLGEIGQWLGDWRALLGVSGIILALSTAVGDKALREAGLATLLAHGYAAAAVQTLKHLIGRARPRLSHDTSLLIGPNFDSGFDSFPSGHTMASVAIATVVALRFPRYRWLAYSTAGVIAAGRVIKGSHFPADVLAGIFLGLLAGHVAAVPLTHWRDGLEAGLRAGWPWAVGLAALLIVVAQVASG